ncbi:class I SAM-dependent methyltransferase [uncultured Desulfovibrio sp.]|uniref:class I SAM-dependent methyltransferase n=1 Tax=uncultured Desulfovibrio sp. TaxID=167968 RepID=UPI0026716E00|nr:class I SAM-dependent methyltransferase [uncultured Desulfovibrio sp.]
MAKHTCLFCGAELTHIFADLGTCPPSNAFLSPAQLDEPEIFYPLQAWVCSECLLVQGPHFKRPQDIFTHDYAYYSSYSPSWVAHAGQYVQSITRRFQLGKDSLIVEVGSNDGYLLQHAVEMGIPCLGIDPSAGAASVAQTKGIPTITDFFTTKLAAKLLDRGKQADILCGINVFAHVPDINDFVAAMRMLLKPNGVMTMEFPHLLRLVEDVQFDTIYHEHYFYYTLNVVKQIVEKHGMRLFDVDKLSTHGGSLRIYACPFDASHKNTRKVDEVLMQENTAGMKELKFYLNFQDKIDYVRFGLMRFLMQTKELKKIVVGYGAAAKGNTLINYFGIRPDLLSFVVDASPHKQGMFLPGSRIPVVEEQKIKDTKPDYIFILPWNLKEEIAEQLSYVREWGGRFVTAIPQLEVY